MSGSPDGAPDEAERHRLLVEWNATAAEFPQLCAHQLFEQQVARSPQAPAVVFKDCQLSYAELNKRANRLAHRLRGRGVGPEVLVGVCMERSPEMVVALLAVWKAGGAYVPIDPSYPHERVSYMASDSGAVLLLADEKSRMLFPEGDPRVVCVDAALASSSESALDPEPTARPDNLAYVMYTSGSTGRPKGAMIVHRGLVNYLWWAIRYYGVLPGSSVPVHSSISFDLTVTSLYTPLLAGGCVEILPEDVGTQSLLSALRRVRDRGLVKLTPAHLELLGRQLTPAEVAGMVKLFVIGGENLLAEILRVWREAAPATRLVNEYGPTETVVGCCIYEVKAGDPSSGSIAIGRPIANTQLYLLDETRQPVPLGSVGELYVGGAGVGRGYLNRPELTEQRFVPDPFSGLPEARLYRTGDLARYRPDGVLEYLGRMDDQVKVRGYRIELGEIEAALAAEPSVQSCAVVAREDGGGDKQLAAYVVVRSGAPRRAEELRSHLRRGLPEYMVPAHFSFLDALPLTANGKVDRQRLPAPTQGEAGHAVVAPRSETERKLAAVWRELLNRDEVGVDEDFFQVGGHSLMAIRAVTRVNELFGVELGPQAIFDDPTIAGLARTVDGLTSVAQAPVAAAGPFYFGQPALFGIYHPPLGQQARDTALLVCPSIGHEHTRAHRALKLLCESAARAGFPALSFDYTGVGDSAGEIGSSGPAIWCTDVLRAGEELMRRSGTSRVDIVGVRLGGTIAAAALRRSPRWTRQVRSLTLWDPLLWGSDFVSVASALQLRFLRDPSRFADGALRSPQAEAERVGDLLLGYSFPDALRSALAELDLRSVDAWPKVALRTVVSGAAARWDDLAPQLRSAGRAVVSSVVEASDGAWEDYVQHEKPLRAGPAIARIVELLVGGGA